MRTQNDTEQHTHEASYIAYVDHLKNCAECGPTRCPVGEALCTTTSPASGRWPAQHFPDRTPRTTTTLSKARIRDEARPPQREPRWLPQSSAATMGRDPSSRAVDEHELVEVVVHTSVSPALHAF